MTERWCTGNGSIGYTIYSRTHTAVRNSEPSYVQGTTNYGIVTSTSASDYPSSGHQEGYYYVQIEPQ